MFIAKTLRDYSWRKKMEIKRSEIYLKLTNRHGRALIR